MRLAFSLIFVVLLLAVATPFVVAVQFWSDAESMVARADQNGTLRPAAGARPLWTAERVIAVDQFSETWRGHAFPCRTLSLMWTDFTDPDAHPPSMPVSQRAATAILGDRRGASVRWQTRRLLVACALERRFSDGQLLRIWLAQARIDASAPGLDAAARAIFNKPAQDLNLDESAKLAALLHEPALRNQPERWSAQGQTLRDRVLARARH